MIQKEKGLFFSSRISSISLTNNPCPYSFEKKKVEKVRKKRRIGEIALSCNSMFMRGITSTWFPVYHSIYIDISFDRWTGKCH